MSLNSIIFVLAAVIVAIPAVVSFIYRLWVLPVVAYHFGEDFPSRRNCAARQRRHTFCRLCAHAVACMYIAALLEGLKDTLALLTSSYAVPIMVFQINLVIAALLFGWAAAARWSNPFED